MRASRKETIDTQHRQSMIGIWCLEFCHCIQTPDGNRLAASTAGCGKGAVPRRTSWLGDARGFEPPGSPAACADPVHLTCCLRGHNRLGASSPTLGGRPPRFDVFWLGKLYALLGKSRKVSAPGRQSQELQLLHAVDLTALSSEAERWCSHHPIWTTASTSCCAVDCVCFPKPSLEMGWRDARIGLVGRQMAWRCTRTRSTHCAQMPLDDSRCQIERILLTWTLLCTWPYAGRCTGTSIIRPFKRVIITLRT